MKKISQSKKTIIKLGKLANSFHDDEDVSICAKNMAWVHPWDDQPTFQPSIYCSGCHKHIISEKEFIKAHTKQEGE